MVKMPKIARNSKHQAHVDRPVVITGKFDLHYEDVVQHNRFAIIAFVLVGLLSIAAFVPAAVYRSNADSRRIILDVESGKVTNPDGITIIRGDITAGNEGYVQFGQ
jgi:hypothetical protein